MNKKQAMDCISGLYPPDTEKGQELLRQAKAEMESWRDLPENILIRYAELCQREENHIYNDIKRKMKTW